jgi:hypothetical protein
LKLKQTTEAPQRKARPHVPTQKPMRCSPHPNHTPTYPTRKPPAHQPRLHPQVLHPLPFCRISVYFLYELRCDERLKTKAEESTRLACTGLLGVACTGLLGVRTEDKFNPTSCTLIPSLFPLGLTSSVLINRHVCEHTPIRYSTVSFQCHRCRFYPVEAITGSYSRRWSGPPVLGHRSPVRTGGKELPSTHCSMSLSVSMRIVYCRINRSVQ